MSQAEKINPNMVYEVKASYAILDFDKQGMPIEAMVKDQTVQLHKLQRRNIAHSKLALRVLDKSISGEDEIDIALSFVDLCVVDKTIRENLKADALAAFELYYTDDVQEDFKGFFEKWGYFQKIVQKASQNELTNIPK